MTVGLRTDLWLKLSVPYSKEDRDFEGCPGVVSLKPQNNMLSSKEYMELAWPRGCTETAIVALVGLVGPQSAHLFLVVGWVCCPDAFVPPTQSAT